MATTETSSVYVGDSQNISKNCCDKSVTENSLTVEDIVLSTAFCFVSVVGVTGNIVLLVAIAFSRKLQTKTNFLIINLSISDLLVSAVQPLQVPPLLDSSASPVSQWLCQVTAALDINAVGSSIITIMLISFNRCILIIKPLETYNRIFSQRNMVVMVTVSWLYPALTLILPMLLGHGRLGFDASTRLCICDFSHPNADTFVLLVSISSIVTFAITFVSYYLLFSHVRRSTLASRSRSRLSRSKNIELIITKNLLFVVCCFVLCVLPFMGVFLAVPFLEGHPLHIALRMASYTAVPLVFDSALNPLIYGWKHPHFKLVIGCLLQGRWRDIPQPSRTLTRFLAFQDGDRQTSLGWSVTIERKAAAQSSKATGDSDV